MSLFFEQEAQDLYDRAKQKDIIETIYADLQMFKDGVGGQMPFTQMMSNESISDSDKSKLIQSLNQFFNEETQMFFNNFVQQGLFDVIFRGVEHFEWLYHEHHVTITSAVALTQEQVERIMTKVAFRMGRTIDTYDTKVDESIIGGVKVESNTFLVDSTIQTQLKAFQQEV